MEDFPVMSDGNLNISDVLAAIETTDPSFAEQHRGDIEMISETKPLAAVQQQQQQSGNNRLMPRVEIVEQPASKALRFRYECEGRSAGSIPGVNSTPENKTFPSIRIVGYRGRAIVVVSCVTKDPPYRPHPHNLVGKEVCRDGVCTVEVSSENMTVSFDKLGIQCVKRKDIEEALKHREQIRVDPFRTGFEHKRQPTSIDLNAVRLCFQVFLEGPTKGKFKVPLKPVVSDPIYDKKAMSDLVICKLSHCSASVAGGTEMVLLCEKVAKEDIQVRFFEERDGHTVWEGFADFQPTHVHKQVAIAFRTPSYRTQQVDQPVQAYIQLKRPSDGATSEALHFQLLPLGLGRPSQLTALRKAFARKRLDLERARMTCGDNNSITMPTRPRFLDEFNNNGCDQFENIDDMLNVKRAYSKISALRALNDIYQFQRFSGNQQRNSMVSLENNNNETLTDNFPMIDDDKTIVPEIESTVHTVEEPTIAKGKTDWFDYTEVGKWVEKTQEIEKDITVENTNGVAQGDTALNDILTDVVELDRIYEDTHAKLIIERQHATQENGEFNNMELDVHDNQTYTSLQMAMKNPVWVVKTRKQIDVEVNPRQITTINNNTNSITVNNNNSNQITSIDGKSRSMITINPDATPPPRPPPPSSRTKRDVVTISEEEPLPPLPPKRIRKTPSMPVLPTTNSNQVLAPQKILPSPPNSTLPKQSKPGLFLKIFSKKSKKDGSTASLPGLDKANSQQSINIVQQQPIVVPVRACAKEVELEGDTTPPYGVDLTEAENYALYTAMAPHATASEFDEMSFYYSPVEDDPDSLRRKRQKFNNSPSSYMLRQVQAEAEKHSTSRIIGTSEPGLLNPIPHYNFNLIKTEPTDRLSPFGGPMGSPSMFPVDNMNSNMGGLRPMPSPGRTPSPMECALYNLPPTQPIQNISNQLQPIIIPHGPPSPLILQDPLGMNTIGNQGDNAYSLGNTNVISNAIGNALNLGDVFDGTQQNTGFELNLSQLDDLNISDIVKGPANGDGAAGIDAEESCMTDSFTKLARNTIQDLCSLSNMYKPTGDNEN